MGFLDQVRQGAQRTAWEADRMMRQNRTSSAVSDARREIDTQTFNLGKAVLESYDGGAAPGPEAAPIYEQIQALRAKVQQLEQEVERIKQEQPPQGAAPPAAPGPAAYTPPPQGYTPPGQSYAPPDQGYTPPDQGAASPAPPYAPPPAAPGPYTPTGAAPGPYAPTGPAPGGYTPTGPAPGGGPMGSAGTGGQPAPTGAPAYGAPAAPTLTEVTECPNCHAPRTDPTALFCQECGTRYS